MPRKTRKRGGQKVKFDQIDRRRVPICEHRDDCGASVFYMLGYTDLETSKYLAMRTPDGLLLHGEVVAMLQLAYGDIRVETLTEDSLTPNDATLAFIVWEENGEEKAHYFIVFRGLRVHVLDPQLKKFYTLSSYLRLFTNIRYVYYLNSTIRDQGDYLVTRGIINAILGDPYTGPTDVLDSIASGESSIPSAADLDGVPYTEPTDDFLDSI
jgi:hypothetical protein